MQGLTFNENGDIERTKVTIVYGSPASGKSTHVRKHRRPGDLVVDLDEIKKAISMTDRSETPDNLIDAAIAVRDRLYDLIEHRQVACHQIWVIGSLPTKNEREDLRHRLKADLIFIEATEAECIERAMKDDNRIDKEKEKKIIDKWFRKYHYE